MKKWISAPRFLLSLLVSMGATTANAVDWKPVSYLGATQGDVDAMIYSFGASSLGRPMASATALGTMMGLDVGLQAYGIALNKAARTAMGSFGAANANSSPLLWGLQVRKGLPLDIDLGLGFLQTGSNEYQYSFDAQYTAYSSWDGMNIAARGTLGTARLEALRATAFAFDVIGSHRFVVGGFLMDPYLGVGVQSGSGALMGELNNLPAGVQFEGRKFTNGRFFAGFPLKFFLVTFTPEIFYGFEGCITGGGKIAVNF